MSALVLLHGFTGHATSWDLVASMLPTELRVFRPCLVGHDPALVDTPGDRFEHEVDRLAEAVRAERLEGARLAGYSMGARVALGLLVRHPDLFSSAVLIAAHPGLAADPDRRQRIQWEERWMATLERDGIEAFVDAWERLPLFATQARLPEEVRAAHRARRLAHDPRGLVRALRVLGLSGMPWMVDDLPRIGVPVRLVAGALDRKFAALARVMASTIPRTDLRLIEGAGHDPLMERPREVASLLTEPFAEEGRRP